MNHARGYSFDPEPADEPDPFPIPAPVTVPPLSTESAPVELPPGPVERTKTTDQMIAELNDATRREVTQPVELPPLVPGAPIEAPVVMPVSTAPELPGDDPGDSQKTE